MEVIRFLNRRSLVIKFSVKVYGKATYAKIIRLLGENLPKETLIFKEESSSPGFYIINFKNTITKNCMFLSVGDFCQVALCNDNSRVITYDVEGAVKIFRNEIFLRDLK